MKTIKKVVKEEGTMKMTVRWNVINNGRETEHEFTLDEEERASGKKSVFIVLATESEDGTGFQLEGSVVGNQGLLIASLADQLEELGPEFQKELVTNIIGATLFAQKKGSCSCDNCSCDDEDEEDLGSRKPTTKHLM